MHKHDGVETPYGPLFKRVALPSLVGQPIEITFLCPFAMLWYVCAISVAAADFFCRYLSGITSRLALYVDGVTPGNPLRPDVGRSFQSLYWSVLELPHWFRARGSAGWFALAFIEERTVKKIRGGMATVAKVAVRQFFSPDSDRFDFLRTGVRVSSCHIRCTFGAWMSDERALREVVSTKGASGSKPCCCCKNVVARTRPAANAYLVHFDSPEVDRFDLHTSDSFAAMVDDLKLQRRLMSSRDFQFREQVFGLVWNEDAIIFDEFCHSTCKFPQTVFYDWMHCLVASGGVGQYQCNEMALEVVSAGVSLADLDKFSAEVKMPKSSRLGARFFQERIAGSRGSHLRAFASEVLNAIAVLGLFCDVVLRPTHKLLPHVACFDDLRSMVNILRRSDAYTMEGQLQILLERHHKSFLALYPDCVKPKLHFLKHAISSICREKVNLSCFAPERKHKEAKAAASSSFGSVDKPILHRLAYTFLDRMLQPAAFAEYNLGQPVDIPQDLREILSTIADVGGIEVSRSAVTPNGELQVEDVVFFGLAGEGLGRVKLLVRALSRQRGGAVQEEFAAVIAPFEPGACIGQWSATEMPFVLARLGTLSSSLVYCVVGGRMFV